ncbi:MAG TPA: hypothetical protein VF796_15615 [Humisphaera sp.]
MTRTVLVLIAVLTAAGAGGCDGAPPAPHKPQQPRRATALKAGDVEAKVRTAFRASTSGRTGDSGYKTYRSGWQQETVELEVRWERERVTFLQAMLNPTYHREADAINGARLVLTDAAPPEHRAAARAWVDEALAGRRRPDVTIGGLRYSATDPNPFSVIRVEPAP